MKALDNPEFYEQLSKPTFTSSSGAVDKAFGDTYIFSAGHTRADSERPWTPVLIEGTRGTTTGASDPRLIGAEMATTGAPTENTSMADFTRGEFDARLEAAEERTNARLAGIEAQLGILTNKIDVWTTHANEAKSEVSELRKAVYSQKWAIIFAVITTGFAVVGLIYGIMAYGLESMAVAISIVTERGNQ